MNKHFQKELEKIKKMMLTLGGLVEDRVNQVIDAVIDFDAETANQIIKNDIEIDDREVELEEECLKIMALYQPVASDLRFLVAMLKINNDVERIGDEAVNIAERVLTISKQIRCEFFFDYSEMADAAKIMLKKALDAMVEVDADLAREVVSMDDKVDGMHNHAYDVIKGYMTQKPDCIGYLLNLFLISRHIERLADHATNIAEEVIYMIDGEIIRHQKQR